MYNLKTSKWPRKSAHIHGLKSLLVILIALTCVRVPPSPVKEYSLVTDVLLRAEVKNRSTIHSGARSCDHLDHDVSSLSLHSFSHLLLIIRSLMDPVLRLQLLPDNMLFQILYNVRDSDIVWKQMFLFQMPNGPLCRLRQSCSFLDSFVDCYSKEFASRPNNGVDLLFRFDGSTTVNLGLFCLKNSWISGQNPSLQQPTAYFPESWLHKKSFRNCHFPTEHRKFSIICL